jgi:hypothetical protein
MAIARHEYRTRSALAKVVERPVMSGRSTRLHVGAKCHAYVIRAKTAADEALAFLPSPFTRRHVGEALRYSPPDPINACTQACCATLQTRPPLHCELAIGSDRVELQLANKLARTPLAQPHSARHRRRACAARSHVDTRTARK